MSACQCGSTNLEPIPCTHPICIDCFCTKLKNTRRCDICNWPILQYELDDIMMHANDDYARSLWYGHSGDESWEPPEDPKWTPEELQGIMNKETKKQRKK
jgi:hypothetical protein